MPVTGYTATLARVQRYPQTAAAFARVIGPGNAEVQLNLAVLRNAMERQLHKLTGRRGAEGGKTEASCLFCHIVSF
jgi:hypothetical protein